jgi:hypothetical protein
VFGNGCGDPACDDLDPASLPAGTYVTTAASDLPDGVESGIGELSDEELRLSYADAVGSWRATMMIPQEYPYEEARPPGEARHGGCGPVDLTVGLLDVELLSGTGDVAGAKQFWSEFVWAEIDANAPGFDLAAGVAAPAAEPRIRFVLEN